MNEPVLGNSDTNTSADGYDEALSFLYGRIDFERMPIMPYKTADLKLQRMRKLLTLLGNPEKGLRIVHIAGTKGKGSTCFLLASILEEAGYKTGVYSSPHLHRLEERFVVARTICSPEQLVCLLETIRPIVAEMDRDGDAPTFFEITTAIAFLHFAESAVDFAVIEVGLGGRLDSTNVCVPEIAVITSISFDHMKQLGNSLSEIAFEKAGIIKDHVPVVSGVCDPEPQEVIHKVARNRSSRLIQREVDFFIDQAAEEFSYRSTISTESLHIPGFETSLIGEHQLMNASLAVACCELLREKGVEITTSQITRGLMAVQCPARVELIAENPHTILDAAHNGASCMALKRAIQQISSSKPVRILVLATTQGKDVERILKAMLPGFDKVIFTKYLKNPRAVAPEDLLRSAQGINEDANLLSAPTPRLAAELASELAGVDGFICVTGSFFIAAEYREALSSITQKN